MKTRAIAITWWNKLRFTDKYVLMGNEFKHRYPDSLTGFEIEKIYLGYVRMKNQLIMDSIDLNKPKNQNPTCPYDLKECTHDMDGYIRCRRCERCHKDNKEWMRII